MRNNVNCKRAQSFIAGLFGLIAWASVGQAITPNSQKEISECEAALTVATSEFKAGRFFSLPSILESCLKRGFTKEQRVRAYILLCQVYLINDNPAEAEASYLNLLQADPEYIATPEIDPIDVVYLSQKFTSRPIYTLSIKGGLNSSFASVIHSMFPAPDSVSVSHPLKLGWALGGGLDWNMSERLALSADLLLSSRSIEKTIANVFDGDVISQTANLTWLDIPISIKLGDYIGKWRPYCYAGYGLHFNFSSKAQYSFENIQGQKESGNSNSSTTDGANLDFTNRQHLFNRSFVLGGGIKYKLGKNYLSADLRMNIGLTNVTKSSNLNATDTEYTLFGYVNDLYRVNSVQLLIGYTIPYYNPRKKGGWVPKGFLGKVLYGTNAATP